MSYKAAKKLVKEGRVAGKIAKAMNTRKKTVYAGDIKKIENIKNRSSMFDSASKRQRDTKQIQDKLDTQTKADKKSIRRQEFKKLRRKIILKKAGVRGGIGLAITGTGAGYVHIKNKERANSWENAAKERLRKG